MIRVCKNSCTKCFGIVQTTDEYAKIKYKEYQIESYKKQFGIDYFQLLINPNSTEREKQDCIDAVLNHTANVTKEIEVLQQEIDRVKHATQEKIVAKPGTTGTGTTTTSTGTAAATAVEAPSSMTSPPPPPANTTTATMKTTSTTPPEGSTGVEVTTTTDTTNNNPSSSTPTLMMMEDPTMSDVPLTSTTTTTTVNE